MRTAQGSSLFFWLFHLFPIFLLRDTLHSSRLVLLCCRPRRAGELLFPAHSLAGIILTRVDGSRPIVARNRDAADFRSKYYGFFYATFLFLKFRIIQNG
jgi:hypothetical protein